jgi:tRNA(Ile2) C34 agmatinyltransferase TiaS
MTDPVDIDFNAHSRDCEAQDALERRIDDLEDNAPKCECGGRTIIRGRKRDWRCGCEHCFPHAFGASPEDAAESWTKDFTSQHLTEQLPKI